MGHGREKIPRNAMTRLKMAFQLLMECEYVLVVENIRTLGEGREIRKRNKLFRERAWMEVENFRVVWSFCGDFHPFNKRSTRSPCEG